MLNNLINFRKKLGFTQEEMAKVIKKTRQHYCNIEKGRIKGTADTWFAIQKKFNLSNEETLNLREVQPVERT
jgi:DNA-binding XRE family transcriptional regulator